MSEVNTYFQAQTEKYLSLLSISFKKHQPPEPHPVVVLFHHTASTTPCHPAPTLESYNVRPGMNILDPLSFTDDRTKSQKDEVIAQGHSAVITNCKEKERVTR